MANLIQFNKEQFEHLSPEEATLVKLLVYRKDFQEEVLKIRDKYGIKEFEKIDPERDIDTYMEKPNPELDDDIESLLDMLGYDEILWNEFVYLFISYNHISKPHTESYGVNKKTIEEIEKQFRKADELLAEGKDEEAEKVITGASHTIYLSKNAHIETSYRNVQVTFTDVPSKDEIDKIMGVVKECQKIFGKDKTGFRPMIDTLNEVTSLSRDGKSSNEIVMALHEKKAHEMKEKGVDDETIEDMLFNKTYDVSKIRKWIERGKKLGF